MAWIRAMGGATKKNNVIDPLDTLGFSTPSNTGAGNVNRTFTKNSIVIGLAGNNFYNTTGITVNSRTTDTINYTTASNGYGLGFVTKLEAGDSFTVKVTRISGNNFYQMYAMYYSSTGQYLGTSQTLSLGTLHALTVPSNAEYTVIAFAGDGTCEAKIEATKM